MNPMPASSPFFGAWLKNNIDPDSSTLLFFRLSIYASLYNR